MKAPNCYRGGFLSTLGPDMEKYMRMKRESGKAFARPSWDLRKFDQYCIDKGLGEPLLTRPFVDAWMASIRDLPPTSQEGLLSAVRGLADYIGTNCPQSARIPDRKKRPYKPESIFARHLEEFIETKLSLGLSYVQEQRALHSFDRFCCSQHISKAEQLLPELIDCWHGSRNRTPGMKDLRYVVREFCIFLNTRKGFNLEIIPQRFKESHPAENYRFRSAFAPLLEAFVQDKRDSGFSYDSERKILKYFDLLCVDHEVHRRELSKE
ncbi:MAG: hypothetical protein KK926_10590 [Methanomethylovorans sp.]|nr:hypothetical protein [Methanomethylovorans sp.]